MSNRDYYQITENYRVTKDSRNIILQEKYNKRVEKGISSAFSGETGFRDVGYFNNLEQVGRKLASMSVFNSDFNSLVSELKKIEDEIVANVKLLNKNMLS